MHTIKYTIYLVEFLLIVGFYSRPVTSPVIGDIIAHDNTTTSQGYPKAESDDIVM